MIKLENISVDVLSAHYYSPTIDKIIEERKIKTLQDFVDEMEKSPEQFRWCHPLLDRLDKVIESMNKSNRKGKEPSTFQFKQYDDSSLQYTDSLNNGDILLLTKPTTESTVSRSGIRYRTIEQIKDYLSLTTSNGENCLVSRVRKIGPEAVSGVLTAVDMYSDQVVRQSQLTDSRDINLFTYQQDEKIEIVDDLYAKIIAYLIYDTKEFVWGELSDAQKKLYLSSIVNNRQMDQIIRDRMISNVSNYTTLPELENVAKGDYKVLQRFIKR